MSKKPSAGSTKRPVDTKKGALQPQIKINPHSFFEFEYENGQGELEEIGKVIFELYEDKVPKTVNNFKSLCLGDKGKTKALKELNNGVATLHYKGTNVNRIVTGFLIQGGDVVFNNGNSGHGVTTKIFEDESFDLKHDPFVLTSPNYGPNTNSSQYAITLCKCPWLDDQHVVFGRVKEGFDVLKKIETFGSDIGRIVIGTLRIKDCGLLTEQELAKYLPSQPETPHQQ